MDADIYLGGPVYVRGICASRRSASSEETLQVTDWLAWSNLIRAIMVRKMNLADLRDHAGQAGWGPMAGRNEPHDNARLTCPMTWGRRV